MQVDRALVDGRVGAGRLDRPEDLARAWRRSARSCRPRPSAARPGRPGSRRRARARSPVARSRRQPVPRRALGARSSTSSPRNSASSSVSGASWAAHSRCSPRISRARRVDDRRLDRAAQELVGVAGEELVERVLAGDVDGQAAAAAAGAAPHLAQAGDRAGEGDADRGVELADVDPELERVGRDHAEQLAGDQPRARSRGAAAGCSRRGRGRSARPARRRGGRRPWRRISSTPLRDFMKQIVRAPAVTSSASSSAASASVEARTPSSSSSSGGFQIADAAGPAAAPCRCRPG